LVSKVELRNASYNRQTQAVLERWLTRDAACVDVGAHRGEVLDQILRVAPEGRHHAFEPIPELAEQLEVAYPGVHVHACAASHAAGSALFHLVENDPGYSGLRRRLYDRPDPVVREIPVQVCRIDDVLPAALPVAFMKLDIEGGEYDALRGAERTIRKWQPLVLFEAGERSSGCYGVTPEMLFEFLVGDLNMAVTTMARWLRGTPPFRTPEDFARAWSADWYFIAVPPTPPEAAPAR
jgi:FkbM family methyltransferase